MANLKEENKWEEGIYQLEVTDPVVGGIDGISNKQAKQLANRTKFLKESITTLNDGKLDKSAKAADSDKLDGLDSSNFIQTSQADLVRQYAHQTYAQTLPDGDYSSSDFWLSVTPGIYYAVSEKGRNKPAGYGIVEVISNGEVSVTWNYWGEVWKWYQTFGKNNSGWKKVVFGDVTPEARANSIVARDGNADFEARYVSAASFKSTANIDDSFTNAQGGVMFWSSDDRLMRPTNLAKFKEVINGVDFACQKDPNGYTKLPNGLIIQWLIGEQAGTEVDVYPPQLFPITFPNVCLFCQVSTLSILKGHMPDQIFQVLEWEKTKVSLFPQWFGTGVQGQIKPLIMAIGY